MWIMHLPEEEDAADPATATGQHAEQDTAPKHQIFRAKGTVRSGQIRIEVLDARDNVFDTSTDGSRADLFDARLGHNPEDNVRFQR
jgi:hypothetical protein